MDRALAALERFFERLLEGPAARVFRAGPQAEQVLRRLERAMETGRVASDDRTYVPSRYLVRVSADDLAELEDRSTGLQTGLAAAIVERAHARGYRLLADPDVRFIPVAGLARGEIRVEAAPPDAMLMRAEASGLHQVPPAAGRPARQPSAGWPMPTAAGPAVIFLVRPPAGEAWTWTFAGGLAGVGRDSGNDIVLPDEQVSRRHGQLTVRHGTLVYTDLGSRNGSFVNGRRVREVALGTGDVVRLGGSTIIVDSPR